MRLADHQSDAGEGTHKAASGDQKRDQQGHTISLPVKKAPGANEAAATKQQARTEQPNPNQLRDLRAQEEMAYWAGAMFWAALATFFVTSIGTLLIWRQVKLTREAVTDTGRATEAMEKANEIARDSNAVANRAWICLSEIKRDIVSGSDGSLRIENGLSIQFAYENVGNTPALEATIFRSFDIIPAKDAEKSREFPPPDENHLQKSNIGPGTKAFSRPMVLTDGQFEQFRSRISAIYIYQLVRYRDIFSDQMHLTEHSGVLTFDGDGSDSKGNALGPRISLQQLGPQNRMT